MHLKYRTPKRYPTIISIVPPGVALIITFRGSNCRCLEQIFMVPKGFEPSTVIELLQNGFLLLLLLLLLLIIIIIIIRAQIHNSKRIHNNRQHKKKKKIESQVENDWWPQCFGTLRIMCNYVVCMTISMQSCYGIYLRNLLIFCYLPKNLLKYSRTSMARTLWNYGHLF